jgi:hypothetical protein
MDKVKKYQNIICKILGDYAKIQGIPVEIKSYTVFDKENHHYQLLSMGWFKQTYTYMVTMHLDIIEGKIWIQQNNSDANIAIELIELGVAKNDIVFGFMLPSKREFVTIAA